MNQSSRPEAISQILEFWFAGCSEDPDAAAARAPFWFQPNPDTDRTIEDHFSDLLVRAAAGELDEWATTAEGCLALIILLDQFPRNLHRGRAQAFANDGRALELTRTGCAGKLLQQLTPVQQNFFLMPYQHTEDLVLQKEGMAVYEELYAGMTQPWKKVFAGSLKFARLHLTLIERFGRFPHRNTALGRPSTADEVAYLSEGGETFGQGAES